MALLIVVNFCSKGLGQKYKYTFTTSYLPYEFVVRFNFKLQWQCSSFVRNIYNLSGQTPTFIYILFSYDQGK